MLITWKGFGEKIKQGRGIWIVVDGELFWNVRWNGQRKADWEGDLSRDLRDLGKSITDRKSKCEYALMGTSDL